MKPTLPADLSPFFRGYRHSAFQLRDARTGAVLVRHNPRRCAQRFAPCSTFKILNALIGLELGVVRGPNDLKRWDGIKRPIADWNRDHTLRTAFAASAVWYFQVMARQTGPERMRKWVKRVGYGNNDTSGPVDRFWLGKPLLISPDEQGTFLLRLHRGDLPFSRRTIGIVRDDLMIRDRRRGAVLRGKTGTQGDANHNAVMGWFVGEVTTRTGESYAFVTNIADGESAWGPKARAITETILRAGKLWP